MLPFSAVLRAGPDPLVAGLNGSQATLASLAIAAGMPLLVVQRMMGTKGLQPRPVTSKSVAS